MKERKLVSSKELLEDLTNYNKENDKCSFRTEHQMNNTLSLKCFCVLLLKQGQTQATPWRKRNPMNMIQKIQRRVGNGQLQLRAVQ